MQKVSQAFQAFICPRCDRLAVRWADVNNQFCTRCEKGTR